jgi:CRISPR-associated protein Cmr5
MMQSRDQKHAAAVWAKIPNHPPKSEQAKTYAVLAHKLPVLIRTAGLAQTLAFVTSKFDGKPEGELVSHLSQIVLGNSDQTMQGFSTKVHAQETDLLEYLRLTRETLAVCLWFKRFAESKLDIKADDVGEDHDT